MRQKIVTFESIHHALKAEKMLRDKGIEIHAMNTPREVSKDCGICLRFAADDEERLILAMGQETAPYAGIYEIDYP